MIRSTTKRASKDKFSNTLSNLGLANKYEKYKLVRNPFPAIGIFSFSSPTESQFSSEIFEGTAKHIKQLVERTLQSAQPTIIFLNAECGQGKSQFLGNLAINFHNDEKVYPLFCQVYTSGGFSIVAEKAIQWVGFEGYCKLMFSFIESLGFREDEIYSQSPYNVFGELVNTLAESFKIDKKIVERVMKPFLNFDEGYSRLFQTSHKYKNLILITLIKLIKKTSGRKVLLIIDGLENRWVDINNNNKEMFFNNVIRFLKLTKGDSIVVFSDSNCLSEYFSRHQMLMKSKCAVMKIDLPTLNVFKSMKLVSNYLASERVNKTPINNLYPFTKYCIRRLYKINRGNARQLVTLCYYLIEFGLENGLSRITLDTLKCLD